MSGGLDGVCEAFKTTREAWRLHADLSKERAAIVRKVAGWVRGDEPPPDGATRADALERGPAWSGWDWSRRGVDVSPAFWNAEREAAADAFVALTVVVAKEAGKVSDAFHAEERLAALRGEVLTTPREWTSPLLEILRPAREAAEAALAALNEEEAAWREWEAVYHSARRTLPLAEIEAARARLEAEEAAKVNPATDEGKPAAVPLVPGVNDLPLGEKHITQEEVASAVCKDVRTVRNWENGKGNPPLGYSRELRLSWNAARFAAWVSNFKLNVGVADKLKFQTATGTGNRYRDTGATWQEAR